MLRDPQVATLTEIQTSWCIGDVLNYNELLDLMAEGDLRVAEHNHALAEAARSARGNK